MTPFMHSVQELLDGTAEAPAVQTIPSGPTGVPGATDHQMIVRSLAEQLVSEANVVLRERGEAIGLDDRVGPGELTFTLTYGGRTARLRTEMAGRTATATLDGAPRRLSTEDELRSLVLTLIAPTR